MGFIFQTKNHEMPRLKLIIPKNNPTLIAQK